MKVFSGSRTFRGAVSAVKVRDRSNHLQALQEPGWLQKPPGPFRKIIIMTVLIQPSRSILPENIPIYHKSQLVVGVEKMPYHPVLQVSFRESDFIWVEPSGVTGHRITGKLFLRPRTAYRVGPVICYESIFRRICYRLCFAGRSKYYFVITNDGWWGDTPGYIQHNSFSSLRAIETQTQHCTFGQYRYFIVY